MKLKVEPKSIEQEKSINKHIETSYGATLKLAEQEAEIYDTFETVLMNKEMKQLKTRSSENVSSIF